MMASFPCYLAKVRSSEPRRLGNQGLRKRTRNYYRRQRNTPAGAFDRPMCLEARSSTNGERALSGGAASRPAQDLRDRVGGAGDGSEHWESGLPAFLLEGLRPFHALDVL